MFQEDKPSKGPPRIMLIHSLNVNHLHKMRFFLVAELFQEIFDRFNGDHRASVDPRTESPY